ncbi:TolC family protein [Candidatus Laterigemmans baculatus]|uniref:TolC family protein n=1 Tax=Candidatus Laterigemmans baculatus TaxID=2770505 RepID=UPI0013DB653F|nr:TolC family protein [Candidatus Laterigemmans baculatus]
MNRSLIRVATYVQLYVMALLATGCTPTQPFFLNESPELRHYLDRATEIEYPDVDVASLEETTQALPPLTLGNHNYEYWDLTLEECVAQALQNARFFVTVAGTAEQRQSVAAQFVSGTSDQFGSVFDVALQQSSTQSIPLTIDGNGNRILARGVQRANQIGGVEDALAEFDAQVSGFISYNTTDRPRNVGANNVFNPQQFQAQDGTQQLAISKRLATGGIATLRQQVLYSWNNIPTGGTAGARAVPSDWTAIVEAQITHPLMRGRGALVNRIPVVLASLNEDISIAEFETQVRNLVRDVEVAYWNLYVAYRNVETEIVGRNSTQVTARFAALQLQQGTGTVQDLKQAENQYFEFRGRLQAALAGSNVAGFDPDGVYGAERRLRELTGLASTDGRLIRPVDEPVIAHVEFDWFEAKTQALYLSPEVRRSKVRLKQRELELIAAKNQLLPQLDLSFTARAVGVGDNLGDPSRGDGANFPAPGSSALAGLTEGNYGEIGARIEFTPAAIGKRRELARINGAKFAISKEAAFIQEQERLLDHQLAGAIAKLETHYRQIQTFAQQLNAAEEEVEARLASYRNNVDTINVVLQSQLRRSTAQIGYYRALGEYNKTLSYVHFLKGTLLENNNIKLEEGPWPKKAYWDALERARERSAGHYYNYGVTRPNVVRTGPVTEPVEVLPSALAPHGIADGVILGTESIDGTVIDSTVIEGTSVIDHSEAPVGSGVTSENLPAADSMEELQMPSGPAIESLPAPGDGASQPTTAPAVRRAGGSQAMGLNAPASYEAGASYEAPADNEAPLPENPYRR